MDLTIVQAIGSSFVIVFANTYLRQKILALAYFFTDLCEIYRYKLDNQDSLYDVYYEVEKWRQNHNCSLLMYCTKSLILCFTAD